MKLFWTQVIFHISLITKVSLLQWKGHWPRYFGMWLYYLGSLGGWTGNRSQDKCSHSHCCWHSHQLLLDPFCKCAQVYKVVHYISKFASQSYLMFVCKLALKVGLVFLKLLKNLLGSLFGGSAV